MTVLSHPQLESVWVEGSSNKIKYLIEIVYRPPSAPSVFWEILNDNLETALNLSKHVIILGDLRWRNVTSLHVKPYFFHTGLYYSIFLLPYAYSFEL